MHVSIMHVHWGREIKTLYRVSFSIVSCIRCELFTQFIVFFAFVFYIACSILLLPISVLFSVDFILSLLFPAFWNGYKKNIYMYKETNKFDVNIVSLFIPLQSKTLSFVARNFLICFFFFIQCLNWMRTHR